MTNCMQGNGINDSLSMTLSSKGAHLLAGARRGTAHKGQRKEAFAGHQVPEVPRTPVMHELHHLHLVADAQLGRRLVIVTIRTLRTAHAHTRPVSTCVKCSISGTTKQNILGQSLHKLHYYWTVTNRN